MKLLSLAAVAARLGVSRQAVRMAIHAGRLAAYEVEGPGGSLAAYVVSEDQLRSYRAPEGNVGRPRGGRGKHR